MDFSIKNITKPTPPVVKVIFRAALLIFTATNIFISGSSIIEDSSKVEILSAINTLIFITYGTSKMFGYSKESVSPD